MQSRESESQLAKLRNNYFKQKPNKIGETDKTYLKACKKGDKSSK